MMDAVNARVERAVDVERAVGAVVDQQRPLDGRPEGRQPDDDGDAENRRHVRRHGRVLKQVHVPALTEPLEAADRDDLDSATDHKSDVAEKVAPQEAVSNLKCNRGLENEPRKLTWEKTSLGVSNG